MATITDLQSTDNGADSMDIINDNFDNLNNDKVEKNSYDGWQLFTGTMPTYDSTTDGVDLLNMTDDLTNNYQKGDWVKITSGAGTDLIYKTKEITSTTMKVVGETSVSGTITAISFSKMHSPQGVEDWRDLYNLSIELATSATVAESTNTPVPYDVVNFDDASMYNTSTHRTTIKVSGRYNIFGGVRILDSNTSIIQVTAKIYVNGSKASTGTQAVKTSGNRSAEASKDIVSLQLNRGDYIEIMYYASVSTSGGLSFGTSKGCVAGVQFIGI
jgi:hypothetical protein